MRVQLYLAIINREKFNANGIYPRLVVAQEILTEWKEKEAYERS